LLRVHTLDALGAVGTGREKAPIIINADWCRLITSKILITITGSVLAGVYILDAPIAGCVQAWVDELTPTVSPIVTHTARDLFMTALVNARVRLLGIHTLDAVVTADISSEQAARFADAHLVKFSTALIARGPVSLVSLGVRASRTSFGDAHIARRTLGRFAECSLDEATPGGHTLVALAFLPTFHDALGSIPRTPLVGARGGRVPAGDATLANHIITERELFAIAANTDRCLSIATFVNAIPWRTILCVVFAGLFIAHALKACIPQLRVFIPAPDTTGPFICATIVRFTVV
jgi:ethanolamine utilization microcompartment shell protein EutS